MVLNHVINGHIDLAIKQKETELNSPRNSQRGRRFGFLPPMWPPEEITKIDHLSFLRKDDYSTLLSGWNLCLQFLILQSINNLNNALLCSLAYVIFICIFKTNEKFSFEISWRKIHPSSWIYPQLFYFRCVWESDFHQSWLSIMEILTKEKTILCFETKIWVLKSTRNLEQ